MHSEFEFFKSFFLKNSYPIHIIEREVRSFLHHRFHPVSSITTVEKLKYYIRMPYFGSSSLKISNEINKLMFQYFPQIQLVIAFSNSYKIGNYFKHKDSPDPLLCSSIIYKYECGSCNASYVGSTARHLRTRIAEHRGVSNRTGLPFSRPSASAIRDHSLDNDHPYSKDNFTIIDFCNIPQDLRVLESIYILKHKPNLNNSESAAPLHITK